MRNLKAIILALLLILITVNTAHAIQRFTIKGKVIDGQTCAPIEGLAIRVTLIDNGLSFDIESDSDGDFKKTFTLMGTVEFQVLDPGYMEYKTNFLIRIGNNDVGKIALLKKNEPVTQVCKEVENTPFGIQLKKMLVEIPEIPEEKGLSENYQKAKVAMGINDYTSAMPLLIEEEKIAPNNFAVKFFLGLCYFNTEDYDKAITKWDEARNIDPAKYMVDGNLAKAWEKKGDKLKAAEFMQKYADGMLTDEKKEDSEKGDSYFTAGEYWYNANDLDKYFAAFSKVIELQPTNGNAYYYVGMYYFSKQMNKEAVEALNKALANNVSEDLKPTVLALIDALKSVN
jgi:tetratricopeptide (TPR) repeat protein